MIIDGEEYPSSKSDQDDLELKFNTIWDGGFIQFWEFEDHRYTGLKTVGILFVDE
ncbi:hypothetical protein N0O92_01385 [Alkalihalobacillus sp. MEB130]|uniref:hypothetical protein n=1 Tax=Alkalihalobacillus sp. MEB130 TaxID=2976704 RepID=UPI0028DF689E|nr:hypothetical protein [Alkalihalobacillus sp. MEB130]MDT8858863.1 hypothetical protein [Alkalihalobacillus sp. MEB130]